MELKYESMVLWNSFFERLVLFFHPNCGCSLCSLSINIYKRQNNKDGSKILLTFNMFYVFTLHNLGVKQAWPELAQEKRGLSQHETSMA
jgi:hypothetical protein